MTMSQLPPVSGALLEGIVATAREIVRPLARAALIVDFTTKERAIERLF
jgi:hypothetical protein